MTQPSTWPEILPQDIMALGGQLARRAQDERDSGRGVCPAQDDIFRALDLTWPDRVKICIVGQDPYHTPGQANGLAFANPPGAVIQPSLANIFKELNDDLGIPIPPDGDLTPWAKRGVLLLNTSLTVYEHMPNSHADWGWDRFTLAVCKAVMALPQPVVFLLWGAKAQRFVAGLDFPGSANKFCISTSHPSPFSAYSGATPFMGSKCFSKANALLQSAGAEPVDWRLP